MNINKTTHSILFNFLLSGTMLCLVATAYAQAPGTHCKGGEKNIISFKIVKSKKIASVCEGSNAEYLVYRFGSTEKVELEYPKNLNKEAWSKFQYSGYIRGGGLANDAMGDYRLSFSNNGTEYIIFQNWRLSSNEYGLGIFVGMGKSSVVLQADKDTQSGSLELLNGNPQIKNAWNYE
ncbi:hypothetical protein ACFPU0_25150 [Pseudomonas sp. GCM10022186]|uniref:hypothetical protein n=1 Tax=Pseudomonas sp. GCM10022186 TaxID=3252650 RepID=UPI003614AA22